MRTQYSGAICNYFIESILVSTVQHTLLTQLRTRMISLPHGLENRTALEKAIIQRSLKGKRR